MSPEVQDRMKTLTDYIRERAMYLKKLIENAPTDNGFMSISNTCQLIDLGEVKLINGTLHLMWKNSSRC